MVRCGFCILSLTSCYRFYNSRIRLKYRFRCIRLFRVNIGNTSCLKRFESQSDFLAICFANYALSQSWLFKKSSRNVEAYLSKDFFESSLFGIQARWRVSPRSV